MLPDFFFSFFCYFFHYFLISSTLWLDISFKIGNWRIRIVLEFWFLWKSGILDWLLNLRLLKSIVSSVIWSMCCVYLLLGLFSNVAFRKRLWTNSKWQIILLIGKWHVEWFFYEYVLGSKFPNLVSHLFKFYHLYNVFVKHWQFICSVSTSLRFKVHIS